MNSDEIVIRIVLTLYYRKEISYRDFKIINLKLNLTNTHDKLTYDEIGGLFGLPREHVRRKLNEIYEKIIDEVTI